MKNGLKVSLAANIVLAVSLLFLGRELQLIQGALKRVGLKTVAPAEVQPAKRQSEETTLGGTPPFQWAQLESTDYRAYVANLRGVGCPERTIRDIITADVDSLYAARRVELSSCQKARDPGRLATAGGLEEQLHLLQMEEATVISTLLGPGPSSEGRPAETPNFLRNRRDRFANAPVAMPLVFQNVDPSTATLDEQQLQVLKELRDRFQQEIGGPNQDPNDPAYRQRWQTAQRNSDDLLQGMLGGEFYLEYQLQAARQSPP